VLRSRMRAKSGARACLAAVGVGADGYGERVLDYGSLLLDLLILVDRLMLWREQGLRQLRELKIAV
jgi:hypothetical protein